MIPMASLRRVVSAMGLIALALPASTFSPAAAAAENAPACEAARVLPADADDESIRIACDFPLEFAGPVAMAQIHGHALWVADQAAWVSTDALRDAKALERMTGRTGAGWITARTSDTQNRWRVAYLVRENDAVSAWADVDVWFKGGKPDTEVHVHDTPRALTESEQAQVRAKALAFAQEMLACSQKNNVAVVPVGEPEGDVLHVYVMPVQESASHFPMTGFHDFRISADGNRVLSHFAQTRACSPGFHEGDQQPTSLVISHLNSPTPTAFHVFFSLTYGRPVFVATTENRRLWKIEKGRIFAVDKPAPGSAEAVAQQAMLPPEEDVSADAGNEPDAKP